MTYDIYRGFGAEYGKILVTMQFLQLEVSITMEMMV